MTTIWLPGYGRHTLPLTPTGRRLLAVMGGWVVRSPEADSDDRA